mmetsp:Transcript_10496/g.29000  ORF Transcript_10496/g.29000 Transcript_10496/m.29000 type:complete len:175 (-) Transcript_10496:1601-2125(-)
MQIQVQHVDSATILAKMKEEQNTTSENGNDEDDESVATQVLDEWIDEQTKQVIEGEPLSQSDKLALDQADKAQSLQSETSGKEKTLTVKDHIVTFLEWILTQLLPESAVETLESDKLPVLVQRKLTENMQTMMEQKLESKQLKADVAVLDEAAQARYFYQNLKSVRERAMDKKK